jgi:hypothetical protein
VFVSVGWYESRPASKFALLSAREVQSSAGSSVHSMQCSQPHGPMVVVKVVELEVAVVIDV